jgi:hypothetical protein
MKATRAAPCPRGAEPFPRAVSPSRSWDGFGLHARYCDENGEAWLAFDGGPPRLPRFPQSSGSMATTIRGSIGTGLAGGFQLASALRLAPFPVTWTFLTPYDASVSPTNSFGVDFSRPFRAILNRYRLPPRRKPNPILGSTQAIVVLPRASSHHHSFQPELAAPDPRPNDARSGLVIRESLVALHSPQCGQMKGFVCPLGPFYKLAGR